VSHHDNMSHLYPRRDTLQGTVYSPISFAPRKTAKPSSLVARPDFYAAYSVADDAKGKAQKLSAEATKEFEKASAAAQAKTGKVELYSGKYYAACTFGGLMACVSHLMVPSIMWNARVDTQLTVIGSHTHCGHSSRSRQDSPPSRFQTLHIKLPSLG
jgi:hypothetical protein